MSLESYKLYRLAKVIWIVICFIFSIIAIYTIYSSLEGKISLYDSYAQCETPPYNKVSLGESNIYISKKVDKLNTYDDYKIIDHCATDYFNIVNRELYEKEKEIGSIETYSLDEYSEYSNLQTDYCTKSASCVSVLAIQNIKNLRKPPKEIVDIFDKHISYLKKVGDFTYKITYSGSGTQYFLILCLIIAYIIGVFVISYLLKLSLRYIVLGKFSNPLP